jgi:hypothetical protein
MKKPVAIIIGEATDDCSRSVVNTLFPYRNNTKLVSVNFLTQVNNVNNNTTSNIINLIG